MGQLFSFLKTESMKKKNDVIFFILFWKNFFAYKGKKKKEKSEKEKEKKLSKEAHLYLTFVQVQVRTLAYHPSATLSKEKRKGKTFLIISF